MGSPLTWSLTVAPNSFLGCGRPSARGLGPRSACPLGTTPSPTDKPNGPTRLWRRPCAARDHQQSCSWSKFLPWVEYSLNAMESSATGPISADVGASGRLPAKPSCGPLSSSRRSANRRRRPAPAYRPGQKVWLLARDLPLQTSQTSSRKLNPRYIGPYTICSIVNPSAVRLDLPAALKVLSDGEPVWSVNKLLAVRRRGRGFQYLVDWVGYGPEDRSWVPPSYLADPSLLEDFYREHPDALGRSSGASPPLPLTSSSSPSSDGFLLSSGHLDSPTDSRPWISNLRAAGLKRKLMKNKEFLEDYRRFMDTILEKGYAMEVPQDQLSHDDNRVWYVPHHGVYHLKKKKIRVVFDCNATFQDVPLNGQLMQGPDLTNKLIEEEAVALVKSLRDLCAEGGFSLTKWVSNSRRVLSSIPAELRATELKDLDLAQDDLPTERALGVQWCFSSRCVKPKNFGTTKVARLHHFSDASEVAYGTASYLVLENDKGRIHCSLAMGKSRVSPLKQITVPRLELTAAVVAVKVDRMLQEEMQIPLQQSIFWTDSTTVLKYIDSETARYKTFVANRITLIREATKPSQWRRYVRTSQNPADKATRGLKARSLMQDRDWINGPQFLLQPESEWPQRPENMNQNMQNDPEVKTITVNITIDEKFDCMSKLLQYYDSWNRLKRAVAWIMEVRKLLIHLKTGLLSETSQSEKDPEKQKVIVQQNMEKYRSTMERRSVTFEQLMTAEAEIIRYSQSQCFPEEIRALCSNKPVKKSSQLYRLDPMLQDGFLRVGGRLNRAAMPAETKHPVILSKHSRVAILILNEIHEKIEDFEDKLENKKWHLCWKIVFYQTNRRLPTFGIDYFGPFEVKRGQSTVKKEQTLTDDSLQTFLCEVESIINGRPITSVSDDPCDIEPLTPNHLLLMKTQPNMPPGIFNKDDLYARKRWRQERQK
ncbi:hypothetical protein D4764_04G0000940 [Takifugu flavidus]|uniref:Chromo domain-containing protein n=1 Tax=Takifugu flavidus TaxID=433684 RepID=A0A5C6N6U7_9TELE|nr:hypothetical protein D4764_04G0000940 [Takifugu flavidus]